MTNADIPDDAIETALMEANRDAWRDRALTAEAELASWEATAAELRRQLAGTNALLATAKAELADLRRHIAAELEALTGPDEDDFDVIRNNAYHRAARVVRGDDNA